MKKSIVFFLVSVVLSIAVISYGWLSVSRHINEVTLTEETVAGCGDAAEGLAVSFRMDSSDSLHWTGSYDYSTDSTDSSFKRGEMAVTEESSAYNGIRFTGESTVPFFTCLKSDNLGTLQEKEVQLFYSDIQRRVSESKEEENGEIRLKDYLDYYPVSFSFQFGSGLYDSDDALAGMKVYFEQDGLIDASETDYADDLKLYKNLNDIFRIPVIDNEYQKYRVYIETDDKKDDVSTCRTEICKPSGKGKDYYEFNPIIALQEENTVDGRDWLHPDLAEGNSGKASDDKNEDKSGKMASDYNLKNRLLFIVNNKTAKGAAIDVSQIKEGYGVYELPIEATATATVNKGKKSYTVPAPKPLADEIKMVYPLDARSEYIDISLSEDHRYLAVFSVEDEKYYVELVDADTWESEGRIELFPSSDKITYSWGEDGSLAVTDYNSHVAIFTRTKNENRPYQLLYRGTVDEGFDDTFFSSEDVFRKTPLCRYEAGNDRGLSVAAMDGKVALVQSLPAGDPSLDVRTAGLACAVIDKTGVIYNGRLKSNIIDLNYNISEDELINIKEYLNGNEEGDSASSEMKFIIRPVRSENRAVWKG